MGLRCPTCFSILHYIIKKTLTLMANIPKGNVKNEQDSDL